MLYFCTYFDRNYLPRGLALYRSLREHCRAFRLWVLCLDEATHESLTQLDLPEVEPIALEDFERNDELLLQAKQNRSPVEYYFTCTPSLPLYILKGWPAVDLITYLDADLFFFASPAPLFEELGAGSVAIIGHRFPPHLRYYERTGVYNVGWLSFRRDENGLACLRWWRERCIEWCYIRVENGRFGDQKYLDDWPRRFQGVIVLEHKGADVAPWNVANYHLHLMNGKSVMVDEQPLIFYHFNGVKKLKQWLYITGSMHYGAKPSLVLRRRVYAPYLQTLFDTDRRLLGMLDTGSLANGRRGRMQQQGKQMGRLQHLVRRIRILPSMGRDILSGKNILVVNGHVI